MLANRNWNNVLQSILDTWLPLLGFILAIVIGVLLIRFVKKKIKNKNDF